MMTGLMPSGKMHLGHKLIVDQMKWYQEHGAQLVIAISDVEAWVARGIPPSISTQTAIDEYVTNYLAAGLKWRNGEMVVYSQWKRDGLLALAAALSKGATLGQMNAMYGFAPTKSVDGMKDAEARTHLASVIVDPATGLDWSVTAGKTFFPFINS